MRGQSKQRGRSVSENAAQSGKTVFSGNTNEPSNHEPPNAKDFDLSGCRDAKPELVHQIEGGLKDKAIHMRASKMLLGKTLTNMMFIAGDVTGDAAGGSSRHPRFGVWAIQIDDPTRVFAADAVAGLMSAFPPGVNQRNAADIDRDPALRTVAQCSFRSVYPAPVPNSKAGS